MSHFFKSALLCAFVFLASGCFGVSAPTHFFLLPPARDTTTVPANEKYRVFVGPVLMPEYLQRSGIVTRINEHEIRIAEFQQWAEQLDRGIARSLAETIQSELGNQGVIAYSGAGASDGESFSVLLDVMQFDINEDGEANFVLLWSLKNAAGVDLVRKQKLVFKSKTNASSVEEQVAQLHLLVVECAKAICASLKKQLS